MISVIVTAYNVDKYIRQAVESVIEQTHRELECIIIDDSSTDNTPAILEELANKDARIRIIRNEKNEGAGAARRKGIEASRGDYILLLDGDDWLENDFISSLYEKAKETGADIVSGGIKVLHENGAWEAVSYGNCICEGKAKVQRFWGEKIIFMNNKLISRKMHDLVPYCTRRFIEDTPTIVPQLYFANKVIYIDNIGYNYRMQQESLTHKASPFKYALFRALCVEDLVNFFEEYDKEYIETIPFGLSYTRLIANIKEINPTKEMIEPYKDEWVEFTTALLKRLL